MSEELLCYNNGCGQTFDPRKNNEDSCRHHTGVPVFHDAYKGWSCCKKKCTDFTEFLNIKGCCLSFHTNEKPPEVEKPHKTLEQDIIEVKPLYIKRLDRPSFDAPMVKLEPNVASSLKTELSSVKYKKDTVTVDEDNSVIQIGTSCKNNACKVIYEGPQTSQTKCVHHPGFPIFHEGLKYWTCCTKRTTDFETFLSQVGCVTGNHVWTQKKVAGDIKCRTDWHQTEKFVYYTIFGKKSDPNNSKFELNPIRLKLSIFFPEQDGKFEKDIELNGIVDVENSTVTMSSAKIEVQLRKKQPGSWSRFEPIKYNEKNEKNVSEQEEEIVSQVESVDLSCI